jgi:hypothetical protein
VLLGTVPNALYAGEYVHYLIWSSQGQLKVVPVLSMKKPRPRRVSNESNVYKQLSATLKL